MESVDENKTKTDFGVNEMDHVQEKQTEPEKGIINCFCRILSSSKFNAFMLIMEVGAIVAVTAVGGFIAFTVAMTAPLGAQLLISVGCVCWVLLLGRYIFGKIT